MQIICISCYILNICTYLWNCFSAFIHFHAPVSRNIVFYGTCIVVQMFQCSILKNMLKNCTLAITKFTKELRTNINRMQRMSQNLSERTLGMLQECIDYQLKVFYVVSPAKYDFSSGFTRDFHCPGRQKVLETADNMLIRLPQGIDFFHIMD